MTQKSTALLKAQLLTTIYPNTSNDIDAGDHQVLVDDMLDSQVNKTTDAKLLGLFDYQTTRNYVIGQGVLYGSAGNMEVYECTTNTTGVWTPGDWVKVTNKASAPGGADTNVQFNNSGALSGEANFIWDYTNKILKLQGNSTGANSLQEWYNSTPIVTAKVLDDGTIWTLNHYQINGDTAIRFPDANTNIAIGANTATALITGAVRNFIAGYSAGARLTNADDCTFVGNYAGNANTTAINNTYIGSNAGSVATTEANNTFLGYNAGKLSTSDTSVYVGVNAGSGAGVVGTSNVFLGSSAGSGATSSYNMCIGTESGRSCGLGNLMIGHGAGYTTTLNYNVFLGFQTGYSNNGSSNVFIGQQAGYNLTGSNKLVIENSNDIITPLIYGEFDNDYVKINGDFDVTGEYQANGVKILDFIANNTFIGTNAGTSRTTGDDNVLIGEDAGQALTTGDSNIYVGYQSGYTNTTSADNVFLGYKAGYAFNDTGGGYNIFIGSNAGLAATLCDENVFIGTSAGSSTTIGYENVFVGHQAGNSNVIQAANVYVGFKAGFSCTSGTNTFIGWQAGMSATSGNGRNTFVGQDCGLNNGTGEYNTFLGRYAGRSNNGGDNNIFVGAHAGDTTTGDNKLILHASTAAVTKNLVYGEFDNYRVGIGVDLAADNLHSTFDINGSLAMALTTKINDYTAAEYDFTILADGGSNTVTITLPTAAGIDGRIYVIKAIDITFTVDIDPDGTEEIDGSASNYTFSSQWESIMIQSDGTNWVILSNK